MDPRHVRFVATVGPLCDDHTLTFRVRSCTPEVFQGGPKQVAALLKGLVCLDGVPWDHPPQQVGGATVRELTRAEWRSLRLALRRHAAAAVRAAITITDGPALVPGAASLVGDLVRSGVEVLAADAGPWGAHPWHPGPGDPWDSRAPAWRVLYRYVQVTMDRLPRDMLIGIAGRWWPTWA